MKEIDEVIRRLDAFYAAEDFAGAKAFLYAALAAAREAGDDLRAISLYNEIMGFERQYGETARAEAAAEAALALTEKAGLENSKPAAMLCLNAATVMKRCGKNDAAAALYARAEALFNRHYPPGDRAFAGLYNNTAALYLDTGAYAKAEYYYDRAERILRRYGDVCDLAVTCFNKALLYDRSDPFSGKAEQWASEGLRILEAPPALRDGYYAYSCRKCAGAAAELGLFEAEARLNARAAEIYNAK